MRLSFLAKIDETQRHEVNFDQLTSRKQLYDKSQML